jgi:hypothetical protein
MVTVAGAMEAVVAALGGEDHHPATGSGTVPCRREVTSRGDRHPGIIGGLQQQPGRQRRQGQQLRQRAGSGVILRNRLIAPAGGGDRRIKSRQAASGGCRQGPVLRRRQTGGVGSNLLPQAPQHHPQIKPVTAALHVIATGSHVQRRAQSHQAIEGAGLGEKPIEQHGAP